MSRTAHFAAGHRMTGPTVARREDYEPDPVEPTWENELYHGNITEADETCRHGAGADCEWCK